MFSGGKPTEIQQAEANLTDAHTPPVIYSESSRAKLVYRVEARPPLQKAALLNPGEPVAVRPIAKDGSR